MRTMFFLLLTIILMSGCVTKAEHEDKLSTWIGFSESSLVESWGPPNGFYETGKKRFLTWSQSGTAIIPGTQPYYTTNIIGNTAYTQAYGGTSPMAINLNCDVTMIIESDTVVSWRYQGNNCYDY